MSMAVHSLTLLPVSSFRGAVQSKPRLLKSRSLPSNPPPIFSLPNYHRQRKTLSIFASVSVSNPELRTGPDDLVASILSKVTRTDGGVLLKNEEHKEVAAVAEELQKYCVNKPVQCPLIFGGKIHNSAQTSDRWLELPCTRDWIEGQGHELKSFWAILQLDGKLLSNLFPRLNHGTIFYACGLWDDNPVTWDVVYCSRPTSPGGGYRSALGRLVFKTKEMIQVVEAPDTVRNKVAFSAFGFLDGEVSLKGTLTALDDKWIQVVFEPPELKIGALEFTYGGQSEVKLQITYVDDKIRLGRGSKGSLFVFQRLG